MTNIASIRKLAKTYGITLAEVDTAPFAYFDEVIPIS